MRCVVRGRLVEKGMVSALPRMLAIFPGLSPPISRQTSSAARGIFL